MQSNPRILVNVLVISVEIPVNLLVKLTKLGEGGAIGARGSRDDNLSIPCPCGGPWEPWAMGPGHLLWSLVLLGSKGLWGMVQQPSQTPRGSAGGAMGAHPPPIP